MDEPAFVERRFELDGSELIVRFYIPTPLPEHDYKCRFLLAWPEKEVRRHAYGVDGTQALMLAMRSVDTELRDSDAYKSGRLTYLGQSDLDLPPTWGEGSLYDVTASSETNFG